jgi:large subunit ribosomal protein L29
MKIQAVRNLDGAELAKQVKETEDNMFRLKFQSTLGQTDGVKRYRELRKARARLLTIQRERELEGKALEGKALEGKANDSQGKKK